MARIDLRTVCRLASLVGLFSAIASCGGPRHNGTIVDPLATPDGFCTQWAKNACNATVVKDCQATSADACIATQKSFCLGIVPASGYSSKLAKACLTAVKDAYADGKLTVAERNTVVRLGAPCDQLSKGPGIAGSDCQDNTDCDTTIGLRCLMPEASDAGTSSFGTCEVPVIVGGGYPCTQPNQVCTEGFFCISGNCLAGKSLNDACSADQPCQTTFKCETSVCVSKADTGSSCSTDNDCKTDMCIKGVGSSTGVCANEEPLTVIDQFCENLR